MKRAKDSAGVCRGATLLTSYFPSHGERPINKPLVPLSELQAVDKAALLEFKTAELTDFNFRKMTIPERCFMAKARWFSGVVVCLSLAVVALSVRGDTPASPAKKGVEGVWEGILVAGKMEMRLVVHVSAKNDAALTATFDSPDQHVKGIGFDSIEFKNGNLRLEFKRGKAFFEGKANKNLSVIKGEWKQGPSSFPLILKRAGKPTEVVRPQQPRKPYPYREEEVAFENKKAGIKFTGTLTLPPKKGSFPGVVLLTGSGPNDRDETIFGHKPFLVLADHLTHQGIAVLRFDDRGVGGSGGNKMQSTTGDFVGDALAAVDFLQRHQEINAKQIGLVGHSEGGIIAPMAAQSGEVAFIVLLAGPGVPGDETICLQLQAILKAAGTPEKVVATALVEEELVLKIVKGEKENEKALKLFEQHMADKMDKLSEEVKKRKASQFRGMLTPWYRRFLTLDPRPALRMVQVPVLALYGEKDVQVPAKKNLEAVKKALQMGGNKNYTVKELPGLNHLFQTCKTGGIDEYRKIEETFSPVALKEISDWILRQIKVDRVRPTLREISRELSSSMGRSMHRPL